MADGRKQACTTIFFLIPENVTSERPIALDVDSLVGSLESTRSGSRSIALIGMLPTGDLEELSAQCEDQGALALVLDLAKAFERVGLPVVWAWATHFSFPRKILRVLCGSFEHQTRVQFGGCAAEPLTTSSAVLPGSKWSCLLSRIVLHDALSEVTKKSTTSSKLRVFADGITALVKKWRTWRQR